MCSSFKLNFLSNNGNKGDFGAMFITEGAIRALFSMIKPPSLPLNPFFVHFVEEKGGRQGEFVI